MDHIKQHQAGLIAQIQKTFSNLPENNKAIMKSADFFSLAHESKIPFYTVEILKGFVHDSLQKGEDEKILVQKELNRLRPITLVTNNNKPTLIFYQAVDIEKGEWVDNPINAALSRKGSINKAEKNYVNLSKEELIAEHKRLIKVLESPSKQDDIGELKKQKQELEGYLKSPDHDIEKSKKADIGEMRMWGGKKYKKQSNGKWLEVSEHGLSKKEHNEKSKLHKENSESQQHSYVKEAQRKESVKHSNSASKLSDKEYSDEEVGLTDKGNQTLNKNGHKLEDIVRQEVGDYTDDQIKSITDQFEEAGLTDRDFKIRSNNLSNPEAVGDAVRRKVNSLLPELRPGMEHSSLSSSDIKDIVHGIVQAKNFYSFQEDSNSDTLRKEAQPEFKSSFGDLSYSTKSAAISAGEKLTKPENYTLLEYQGKHIITTNKRASDFTKQYSDVKKVGKFLPNSKFATVHPNSTTFSTLEKAFQTLNISFEKAEEESLEKAAGDRGGRVIGYTSTGKPIYDSASHPAHKDFSFREHHEASNIHHHLSVTDKGEKAFTGQFTHGDGTTTNAGHEIHRDRPKSYHRSAKSEHSKISAAMEKEAERTGNFEKINAAHNEAQRAYRDSANFRGTKNSSYSRPGVSK